MLDPHDPLKFASELKPHLIVIVDTEEEFDWSAPPDRNANSVNAIDYVHLAQDVFNEYGVKPCYVVDYPVASKEKSINVIKSFLDQGECEIGAQLHPWVTPPFEETLSAYNTFAGNLSAELELAKIGALTKMIEESFSVRPVAYKAGRYGLGPNTAGIIEKLGYEIDLSVCPAFDFSPIGGPNYEEYSCEPFRFGSQNGLLEVPLTSALVGPFENWSRSIYRLAGRFDFIRCRGALARLGLVDRLLLSPEGYTPSDHIKLTRYLYERGVRVFSWTFHSTSLMPGATQYTQTTKDVNEFLLSFRRYFDFFFNELKGVCVTPSQLKKEIDLL